MVLLTASDTSSHACSPFTIKKCPDGEELTPGTAISDGSCTAVADFMMCEREAHESDDLTPMTGTRDGFQAKVGDKITVEGGSGCPHAGTVGYVYCQYSDSDWIGIVMEETNTGHSLTTNCHGGITTHHCDHANSMWYFDENHRRNCKVKNLSSPSMTALSVVEKADTISTQVSADPNFQ